MGPIGIQEMIAIFILALVLFGPRNCPSSDAFWAKVSASSVAPKTS